MKLFSAIGFVFLLACVAFGSEPKQLSQKLLDEGWISLFDGETLYGWQPTGDAKWKVVDGEIRTSGEKPGFLMTTTEWANYVLQVDFRATAKTNSGVFLRTGLNPKDPAKDCYELNIAPPDNPFPTGSFVAHKKVNLADKLVQADTWHTFEVHVCRGLFNVMLDGETILEYAHKTPLLIGHIGLQSREGAVAFRNIRLRPIQMPRLFDGHDLAGWNIERAEKCKFDVTKDEELHLTNGPGQLETDGDFKNFVLQLECKVNGDGLNSGIFFRTLRKGRWAGYESQIQNSFKDGDRTKPKDFGTGAIYRRQAARRVVADDRKWFANTIVANGPHMAVWVNGYQVSDWTDTRPEKENAREGKRLGGGVIAIQGHDKTTDLLFRKIRAMELPR